MCTREGGRRSWHLVTVFAFTIEDIDTEFLMPPYPASGCTCAAEENRLGLVDALVFVSETLGERQVKGKGKVRQVEPN